MMMLLNNSKSNSPALSEIAHRRVLAEAKNNDAMNRSEGYASLSRRVVNGRPIHELHQVFANRNRNLEIVLRHGGNAASLIEQLKKGAEFISDRGARYLEAEFNLGAGFLDTHHEIISRSTLQQVRIKNLSALVSSELYCDCACEFLSTILSTKPTSPATTATFLFDPTYCSFDELSYYLRSIESHCELPCCALDTPDFAC